MKRFFALMAIMGVAAVVMPESANAGLFCHAHRSYCTGGGQQTGAVLCSGPRLLSCTGSLLCTSSVSAATSVQP